jgi:hypothetical protein
MFSSQFVAYNDHIFLQLVKIYPETYFCLPAHVNEEQAAYTLKNKKNTNQHAWTGKNNIILKYIEFQDIPYLIAMFV